MTMKKHLNIFIPDDLLKALDAHAAGRSLNRSQVARLAIRRYVVLGYDEPYTPPALPNWQTEAWTALLRGLFGDERLILTDDIKALLVEAVAKLNERDTQILALRFGLDGPQHALEEVGAIFGIKRSRVHQIETALLERLRYWLRGSGIWKLLEGQLNEKEKQIEKPLGEILIETFRAKKRERTERQTAEAEAERARRNEED